MGHLDFVGDKLVFGNWGGVSVLQELGETIASQHRMEVKYDRMFLELNQLKEKCQALERIEQTLNTTIYISNDTAARCRALEANVQGYRDIRNRFIDTFRRDILSDKTACGMGSIHVGNARAHGGDCVTDAQLFEEGGRSDPQIMELIYGVSTETVLRLCKCRE